jgi:hypothetical protein
VIIIPLLSLQSTHLRVLPTGVDGYTPPWFSSLIAPITDLEVLVCSPHRQRLGAGSALVRWGIDLADSLGLVSWLEASPYGYPLYKRYGYKDIAVIDFTAPETWGGTPPEDRDWGENSALEIGGPLAVGELRQVSMKRLPKTSH